MTYFVRKIYKNQLFMTENKKTFGMGKANLIGLIFGIPFTVILLLPYYFMYGIESTKEIRHFFIFNTFIPSIIIGIIVHEAIHGIAWAIAAKIPITEIKFGFQVKTLTPFAHCKVPINIVAYRIGTLMPFLILGLLPYIYSLAIQNAIVMGFSLFFSFAAIGDLMILWITKDIAKDKKVQDHPTEAGVTILD
ncbi:MAG: DUF3267 domain-containing protein [Cytophagales bacterium]|nr:MAG: DUF3267 domain-containing protein [Cytophagales bacterium]